MENKNLPVEIPVQLTQQDYVRSQELIDKAFRSNRLLSSGWMSVLVMILCVLMVAVNIAVTKEINVSAILLLILLVAVEVTVFITNPKLLRRNSRIEYAQTLFKGYCYDGILRVGPADIRKVTMQGETAITYVTCPAYIESKDMMIFLNAQRRHIVIPARFLTEEDAQIIRELVFQHIPAERRALTGKLVAGATEHGPMPSLEPKDEEVLYSTPFQYTIKEMGMFAMNTYWSSVLWGLPNRALVALTIATVAFLLYDVAAIPVFLISLMLIMGYSLVHLWIHNRRVAKSEQDGIVDLMMMLTEDAIHIQGRMYMRVPWEYVTRAVETADSVEFHTEALMLFVPKKFIEDMDELRRVVDEQMEKHRK